MGLTSQVRIYGLVSLEKCCLFIFLNTGFDLRVRAEDSGQSVLTRLMPGTEAGDDQLLTLGVCRQDSAHPGLLQVASVCILYLQDWLH